MRFLSLLGADKIDYGSTGIFSDVLSKPYFQNENHKWLGQIIAFLGQILIPVTIVILAAGIVWCVYLGIQLARAEDAGKAGDIKKRLINVAIAFVVTLVAVWIIALLMAYVPTWFEKNYVSDPETNNNTTTMIETAIRSFLPRL